MDKSLVEILCSRVSGSGQKTFGNEKSYQPVSRILFPRWCGRSSFIWPLHYCRDLAAYPPAQPLAEHRAGRPQSPVYVAFQHARFTRPGSYLPEPWALTPRFQPHPPLATQMDEAVIFCGTICGRVNAPRLLTGTLPCAVRTFLPLCEQGAMTRLVAG